jgi:TatD DNase family protein
MFDTHVNLHGDAFKDDLDAVLDRARAAGVGRFLAICDRFDNFPSVRAIAEAHPDIWCSTGTHPHHAKDFTHLTAAQLVEAAAHPRVAGIGETGLDLHYGYSALDDQVRCFEAHIEAARETQLPLIIHTREADDLTGDILEREFARGPFSILLHCYTGGQRLADRALALGACFSVSGILSFKSAAAVRDVIATVPVDRLILETDCPYLAPIPMRGRRNEPAYLVHVADALARLKGVPSDDIRARTHDTALRLFSRVAA